MTTAAGIFEEVVAALPGCSENAVKYGLYSAAHELCTRGRVWQGEEPVEDLVDGFTYEVSSSVQDAHIVDILNVYVMEAGRTKAVDFVTDVIDESVRVILSETADKDTVARVTYAPVAPIKVPVPDFIMPVGLQERYREALYHGTLYRMMSQPGRPYSHAANAEFHRRLFRAAIDRARRTVSTSQTVRSRRLPLPAGARGVWL